MTKLLYIFSGTDREELLKDIQSGRAPDTALFGYNHMKDSKIEASYLQIGKSTFKGIGAYMRWYFLTNALYLLFSLGRRIKSNDVVFVTSSAYLNLIFLKRLGFFRRQKFLLLNIDMTIVTKKATGLQKFLIMQSLRGAQKIICLSESQVNHLLSLGIESDRAVFIPLGIDKTFYKLMPDNGSEVLAIGRDSGRDYETFMMAMRGLEAKGVVICAEKNVEDLKGHIPQNVMVTYDKFNDEVRPYYERAICFVVPAKPEASLMGSDCTGQTSVLDAMAYGRAVIITENSWVGDYFEIGRHLLTVLPRDPDSLAEAIKKITEDTVFRERAVSESRTLISNSYNSESMARKIAVLVLDASASISSMTRRSL